MKWRKQIRVLLVADFRYTHSKRYAQLLSMVGCDLCLLDIGEYPEITDQVDCRYYSWPRNGRRFLRSVIGSRLTALIDRLLIPFQLRYLWQKLRPDICHVQPVDDRALMIAESGIEPLVLTAWGTDIRSTQEAPENSLHVRAMSKAISSASLLIADSNDTIDTARRLTTNLIPMTLIPLGIDTGAFRPKVDGGRAWRHELGIPDSATVILSPRALSPRYGHESIIRAFGSVVKNEKCDAYLIFKHYVIEVADYSDKLKAIAQELGIADRIRIVPEVLYQDVPKFYSMGDFAINFPDADAFPVTFFECLSCELPFITKRLPAYETFDLGRYIQFTEEPTQQALEKKIVAMMSTYQGLRNNLSEARRHICLHFDESITARNLVQAYRSILEQRNALRQTGEPQAGADIRR